jgi:hypothetical protein
VYDRRKANEIIKKFLLARLNKEDIKLSHFEGVIIKHYMDEIFWNIEREKYAIHKDN